MIDCIIVIAGSLARAFAQLPRLPATLSPQIFAEHPRWPCLCEPKFGCGSLINSTPSAFPAAQAASVAARPPESITPSREGGLLGGALLVACVGIQLPVIIEA